jgi:DNA modification methylase
MDISFTSPPYFNLEIYSSDKAKSTKNYDNYSLWVEEYMRPTCENILYYLKPEGYAMINIKNLSKKEPIFDDFVKTFLELGMKRLPDEHLHISSKSWNNEETFLEPVMVFQKV